MESVEGSIDEQDWGDRQTDSRRHTDRRTHISTASRINRRTNKRNRENGASKMREKRKEVLYRHSTWHTATWHIPHPTWHMVHEPKTDDEKKTGGGIRY